MTNPSYVKYKSSISSQPGLHVVRLAYSPDGRYLAIGDAASSNIIIWDLKEKREQARIHVRSNARMPSNQLHWEPGEEIHWSPDGRYLTNGVARPTPLWDDNFVKKMEFWDPLTGKVTHELSTISVAGKVRFNRDGSKLIVHSGQVPDKYRFAVYDTHTWQVKDFETGGIVIDGLTWTADDKVFVIGTAIPPGGGDLQLKDGNSISRGAWVVRTIDPSEKRLSEAAFLFDAHKAGEPGFLCEALIPDFANQRVAILGKDRSVVLFDTQIMKKLNYVKSLPTVGSWGRSLSKDGKYLFLLNHGSTEATASLILDVQTGQQVGTFTSKNTWGLATSPDGKTLAIGRENQVDVYDIRN